MSDLVIQKATAISNSINNAAEASRAAMNFLRQIAHLKSIVVVEQGVKLAQDTMDVRMKDPRPLFYGVELYLGKGSLKSLEIEPHVLGLSNKLSAKLYIGEDVIRWNPRDGKQSGPNGHVNKLIDFTPKAVEEMVKVAFSVKKPIEEDSLIYSCE